MPEFRFSCPLCKQLIECDTGYAGSRINCPSCQKSVVVPPPNAPAGEPMLQIKTSTLKKAGAISLCALFLVGVAAAGIHFLGGPRSVTFRAFVDGTDVIKLSGKRLWIEHRDFERPIKMTVRGQPWEPVWGSAPNESSPDSTGNLTEAYPLPAAFKPRSPNAVKVSKRLGRGTVSIIDLPKPSNDQTVAILVDDGPMGGADTYEFTVSW